ncbi:MAG: 5'-3' exonuclease H3TH domain-containing protein, partial [Gammaproteobacteria bacterium]
MVFLIDASVYIFRAWFSLPPTLTGPDGEPVNAVYGFTGFLLGLLESEQPAHVAAAFDESLTTSFRNALYPDYKASRELPPPELEAQLRACAEVAAALGLATFASPTYEADDLIGGLAATARRASRPVTIVSRDKDLGQLLQDGDTLWDGADRRAGPADIEARFGVPPRAIPDLFGLMGDAVDNIPGVRGIGARTAAALIAHFGDLEALYANLDSIDSLELRGTARIRRLLE